MLISDEWRALNAQLHVECSEYGSKHRQDRIARLKDWARKTEARSVLDYGCGKGTLLKESGFRFRVRGYDPAVKQFAGEPAPADMVACWDVLEHVEPDCLDAVLDHIHRLAQRAVHIAIGTRPDSTKLMPDGRNPHLIIEPAEWWMLHLRKHWPRLTGRFNPGDLEVFGRA